MLSLATASAKSKDPCTFYPAYVHSCFGKTYTFSYLLDVQSRLPNPTILSVKFFLMFVIAVSAPAFCTDCVPFDQAHKHIGETRCVTGKVVRVAVGSKSTHYLDFCEDYRLCPFSVVIFSHDMKNIGDVRQLAGKVIEIRGEIKEYDDRAEIILESRKQLAGEAAQLPPLPKNFDVEQRGHFSTGKFRGNKSRSTYKKKGTPTMPADIPEDVESE